MQSLQTIYNVYSALSAPMSSIASSAVRTIARPLMPAGEEERGRSSSSRLPSRDPTASSSRLRSKSEVLKGVQADRRRRRDEPDYDRGEELRKIQADRRRKRDQLNSGNVADSSDVGEGKKATPLVNYGSGLRQTRRKGATTIKAMAPIMEYNDIGDDPYVMRPKVQ